MKLKNETIFVYYIISVIRINFEFVSRIGMICACLVQLNYMAMHIILRTEKIFKTKTNKQKTKLLSLPYFVVHWIFILYNNNIVVIIKSHITYRFRFWCSFILFIHLFFYSFFFKQKVRLLPFHFISFRRIICFTIVTINIYSFIHSFSLCVCFYSYSFIIITFSNLSTFDYIFLSPLCFVQYIYFSF